MRLTKLDHATLLLEKDGRALVIDPGSFTPLLADVEGVVGVVVTHEHADHWSPEQLGHLRERNPGVPILGPAGVVEAASGFGVEEVAAGQSRELGGFRLRFFGGEHARIHRSVPTVDNVGVLVDDLLYYPGDALEAPGDVSVDTLAAPSSGPWLKTGEAMDFVLSLAPRRVFPTHDAVHSELGRTITNGKLRWAAEEVGARFVPLPVGGGLPL